MKDQEKKQFSYPAGLHPAADDEQISRDNPCDTAQNGSTEEGLGRSARIRTISGVFAAVVLLLIVILAVSGPVGGRGQAAHTTALVLLALAVLGELAYITTQIRLPLSRLKDRMQKQESAQPAGAEELRSLTLTYNELLRENRNTQRKLTHEASHDPLTGLYNRSAYDLFMEHVDKEHIALLIVDVDHFKSINDSYGHDVGDRVLRRVAEILNQSFRSVDFVCRFGGDEFVVVMTRVSSAQRQLVVDKIDRMNALLQASEDDLPRISLSIGAAFADRENPVGDIFKDADTALYRVKGGGRGGGCVYGSEAEAE